MDAQAQAALIGAGIGGLFTTIGWIVTAFLNRRSERQLRRDASALEHLQMQIQELYGPLLGIIQQSRMVYEVAQARLPVTATGNIDQGAFEEEDSLAWLHFVERHFLPLNRRIHRLLERNRHLLETPDLPESYRDFAKHHAVFECLHGLWKDKGIPSAGLPGHGWPAPFEADVEKTLAQLRKRYDHYRELSKVL